MSLRGAERSAAGSRPARPRRRGAAPRASRPRTPARWPASATPAHHASAAPPWARQHPCLCARSIGGGVRGGGRGHQGAGGVFDPSDPATTRALTAHAPRPAPRAPLPDAAACDALQPRVQSHSSLARTAGGRVGERVGGGPRPAPRCLRRARTPRLGRRGARGAGRGARGSCLLGCCSARRCSIATGIVLPVARGGWRVRLLSCAQRWGLR